jgi:hypothetical protein
MGDGVDAHPGQFFFSLVFQWFFTSLSVRPGSCAAITDHRMQLDDGLLFRVRELAVLQVVGPPETAALPAPLQPCVSDDRLPSSVGQMRTHSVD